MYIQIMHMHNLLPNCRNIYGLFASFVMHGLVDSSCATVDHDVITMGSPWF